MLTDKQLRCLHSLQLNLYMGNEANNTYQLVQLQILWQHDRLRITFYANPYITPSLINYVSELG